MSVDRRRAYIIEQAVKEDAEEIARYERVLQKFSVVSNCKMLYLLF